MKKKLVISVSVLAIVAGGGYYAAQQLLKPEQVETFITAQANAATGRSLSIHGGVQPQLGLSPSLVFHDVRLSNADWGSAESMLSAKKLSVSFKLLPLILGELVVADLTLEGAKVMLERKDDRANWQFSKSPPPAVTAKTQTPPASAVAPKPLAKTSANDSSVSISRLRIRNSQIHYHDAASDTPLSLQIDQLDGSNISRAAIERASLKGAYNGANLQLNASQMDDILLLEASLKAAAELGVKGSYALADSAFDLQLTANAAKLSDLLSMLGADAGNHAAPIRLNASLGGTPELIKISKLQGSYDSHPMQMSGQLDLSQSKPHLRGNVHFPSLNFRRESNQTSSITADTANATTPSNRSETPPLFSKAPLPLGALGQLNAYLKLTADALHTSKLSFSAISGELELTDKWLKLANLKAKAGKGALYGNLSANARQTPAELSGQLHVRQLALGDLMQDLTGQTHVSGGSITSELDFTSQGNSLHHIMANASGRLKTFIDTAQYTPPTDLAQASEFFEAIRGGAGSGPVTLQCAISHWAINKGIANSEVLAIKSDSALIKGSGKVDLGQEHMRIGLKARANTLGFADVLPPLVIAGNLQRPSVTLDATSSLLNIGKFAVGALSGVGLAAVVGEQITDKLGITEDNNPCLKAIAEAEAAAKEADSKPKAAYKNAEDGVRVIRDNVKDNAKDALKDAERDVRAIRDGFKALFK